MYVCIVTYTYLYILYIYLQRQAHELTEVRPSFSLSEKYKPESTDF